MGSPLDTLLRKAANDGTIISFAGGLPSPDTFPRQALSDAATQVFLEGGPEPLQYGWPEGQQCLREVIAAGLQRRGLEVDTTSVLITNGAQDALRLIVGVLEPSQVQVDPLSYSGALDMFRGRGYEPVTGPAELRYAMPAMHNPWGRGLDEKEQAALLESKWLIEDEAYAELRFDGTVPAPLAIKAREKVFHVGTLSKTVAPGLRIGWLVAPKKFEEKLLTQKNQEDMHSNGIGQAIAAQLLEDVEAFDARLASLRMQYARRSTHLMNLLAGVEGIRFEVPTGGFSVWIETDLEARDEDFLRRGVHDFKVAFDPGSMFRAVERDEGPIAFRLSFSALPEHLFEDGVDRLSKLLRSCR